MKRRVGPAGPLFGPPRSQGTCCLVANGSAVKKRLLRRVGPAVAIFSLILAVACVGPTTLWIAVVKVAVALGIFAERWRSPVGLLQEGLRRVDSNGDSNSSDQQQAPATGDSA
jgi:hypothetical protein